MNELVRAHRIDTDAQRAAHVAQFPGDHDLSVGDWIVYPHDGSASELYTEAEFGRCFRRVDEGFTYERVEDWPLNGQDDDDDDNEGKASSDPEATTKSYRP